MLPRTPSTIAQEKHPDPNFPDPAANNTNLRLYAETMAEAAKAGGGLFVDLFSASEQAYARAKLPLTTVGRSSMA